MKANALLFFIIIGLISCNSIKLNQNDSELSNPKLKKNSTLNIGLKSIKVDSLGRINDTIEIRYLNNVYCIQIEHGELCNPVLISSLNKKQINFRNHICNVNFKELRPEDINIDFIDKITFGYDSNLFLSLCHDRKGRLISFYKNEVILGEEKYNNPSVFYKFYKNEKGIKRIKISANSSDSIFFFSKSKSLRMILINKGDVQTKQKTFNQTDSLVYYYRFNQFISAVDNFNRKCQEIKNIKKPDQDVIKVLRRDK